MSEINLKERQFVIYGDSLQKLFHWLTPYIELAGFTWEIYDEPDSFGSARITIKKK